MRLNQDQTLSTLLQAFPIPTRDPGAVHPQRDAKAFPPVSILYRVAQHEWVILGIVPKLRQIVLARTNALKPGGFVLCKDRGKKFVG